MKFKLLFQPQLNVKRTLKLFLVIFVFLIGFQITESFAQSDVTIQSLAQEIENSKTIDDNKIILLIYTKLNWIGEIQDGNYVSHPIQGNGDKKFFISCGETNVVTVSINPGSKLGTMDVYLIKNGKILNNQFITTPGENFNSSIDCSTTDIFQTLNSESIDSFHYFLAGISVSIIVIFIMIIKNRLFIKQNNTKNLNY